MQRRPLLFMLLLAACAEVSPQLGHDDVARLVQASANSPMDNAWTTDDAAIAKRVTELLKQPLTLTTTAQLTLLNNPELRATYAGFGIAQADLLQAGLLRNPSLGASLRFPNKALPVDLELSLVADVLDIFVRPLRKKLAADVFEQEKVKVAQTIVAALEQTRALFVSVQASQQLVALRRTVLEAGQAAAELATLQQKAGNISALDWETQQAAFEQTRLDLTRDELDLAQQRAKLSQHLGLQGQQVAWEIALPLAEMPTREVALAGLTERAQKTRLDLVAARQQVAMFARALELARTWRYVGAVQVGASYGQSPEAYSVLGPVLTLDLPIFDQRQALIARLEAQRLQAERQLAGLGVTAEAEVRLAWQTMHAQRQMVDHYRNVLIPQRERIVQEAQRHYNGMFLGVFQLVQAKQAEMNAYREYLEAVRDFWLATMQLERALGFRLEGNS